MSFTEKKSAVRRRLPAEWEPQGAVLLAWPHAATDWAPVLDEVEPVFAALAAAVSRRALALIVAPDPDAVRPRLAAAGADLDRVRIVQLETNDTWARDFGPLTVLNPRGRPLLLDFGFNGWGLKFAADLDNQVTRRLHAAGGFGRTPLRSPHLVLEGGSVESDGRGTLLTTAACLLNANRNPGLTRTQIERKLLALFGANRLLWLEQGHLEGDDTDAHIDTLARLAPEDTIVYVACADSADSHYAALQAMESELRAFRTAAGRPYRLLPLPWPKAKFDAAGNRLPATYANFLVLNGAVLAPTYRDVADAAALAVIGNAFPGHEILALDCLPLILQHGSLHCVTMQLPAAAISQTRRAKSR